MGGAFSHGIKPIRFARLAYPDARPQLTAATHSRVSIEEKAEGNVQIARQDCCNHRRQQKLGEITTSHFDKTFGINARGLLFTVQKALPLIRDGGSIILISSIAAFKGLPAHGTYSASKAAVRSFVRTWTAELRDRGIRVNAISPGAIDTPIIDSQAATKEGADAIRAKFAAATPLNRIGRPEELAAAVLFLASEGSSYVAGADVMVDGGLSAL